MTTTMSGATFERKGYELDLVPGHGCSSVGLRWSSYIQVDCLVNITRVHLQSLLSLQMQEININICGDKNCYFQETSIRGLQKRNTMATSTQLSLSKVLIKKS